MTGVVRTLRPLPETAAYRLHILAEDNDGDQAANASVDAMIKVSPPKDPSEYTNLNFLVQGLGFMQDQPRINEAKFGLFVNNHPDFEGRLVASVGAVSSQASFQASRTPAVSVRAVLLDADVWLDNPVVRVLAQVQDPSHSVRTFVERSHVGFGVVPGKELADLRCGNVQQVKRVALFYRAQRSSIGRFPLCVSRSGGVRYYILTYMMGTTKQQYRRSSRACDVMFW